MKNSLLEPEKLKRRRAILFFKLQNCKILNFGRVNVTNVTVLKFEKQFALLLFNFSGLSKLFFSIKQFVVKVEKKLSQNSTDVFAI